MEHAVVQLHDIEAGGGWLKGTAGFHRYLHPRRGASCPPFPPPRVGAACSHCGPPFSQGYSGELIRHKVGKGELDDGDMSYFVKYEKERAEAKAEQLR